MKCVFGLLPPKQTMMVRPQAPRPRLVLVPPSTQGNTQAVTIVEIPPANPHEIALANAQQRPVAITRPINRSLSIVEIKRPEPPTAAQTRLDNTLIRIESTAARAAANPLPEPFGLTDLGLTIFSSRGDVAMELKKRSLVGSIYVVDQLFAGRKISHTMV